MAVPAGSYSLSSVLRALGIRDPRVIPSLSQEGTITPTINFGNLDTLVSEIIEARSIVIYGSETAIPNNEWRAVQLLSVAPGGSIIEFAAAQPITPGQSIRFSLNIANVAAPFVPAAPTKTPLNIGGQSPVNIYLDSGLQANPRIEGDAFGGTTLGYIWPADTVSQGHLFARMWIPPGWSFWALFATQTGGILPIGTCNAFEFVMRVREIPQQQGAN